MNPKTKTNGNFKDMKNILLVFFFCFSFNYSFSAVSLFCKVQYYYEIFHEPPPIVQEGIETENGNWPTIANTGNGYWERNWSNVYRTEVVFLSGAEYNAMDKFYTYKPSSIIAVIKWNNGGVTIIESDNWFTNLYIMTEKEVKYTSDGRPINYITGYDKEKRYWKIFV